ncbi:MAG: hypothetical protein ACYDAC_10290 [Candidatus Dormibacteria bacterium]
MHGRDAGPAAGGAPPAGAAARRPARLSNRAAVSRPRRRAGLAVIGLAAPLLLAAVTACGSSGGQLRITLSGDTTATYAPGDLASLVVTVTNQGPGAVNGVTVHAALPTGFTYRSTTEGNDVGATRTQPITADANSSTPLWGVWDLGAPGTAGPAVLSKVEFTFTMAVAGLPGKPLVSAYAVSDASSGQVNAAPFPVPVVAAAQLSIQASVTPTVVTSGSSVAYQVRVVNTGTDAADIAVLVTLPPALMYSNSILPFAGNASRAGGTNPDRNSLLVYYDGFTLPAKSAAGPGFIVIQFKATVISNAAPGIGSIDVSVTDSKGDIVAVHAVAPVTINAGPSASPRSS